MLSEKHASDMLLSISWVCYYQQEAEAAYVYGNAIYDKIHLIKSLEDLYSHMLWNWIIWIFLNKLKHLF